MIYRKSSHELNRLCNAGKFSLGKENEKIDVRNSYLDRQVKISSKRLQERIFFHENKFYIF